MSGMGQGIKVGRIWRAGDRAGGGSAGPCRGDRGETGFRFQLLQHSQPRGSACKAENILAEGPIGQPRPRLRRCFR